MFIKGTYFKGTISRILFIPVTLLLFYATGFAQTQPIDNGTAWLRSNQNQDGSWGAVNSLRDTVEVVNTYKILKISDSSYSKGLSWLNSSTLEGNDLIARKIIALSGAGTDVSSDITKLTSAQNTDGGWGYREGYESNPLDATLALHALQPAMASDSSTIVKGLQYIISTQNPDGSWDISSNNSGDISTTAFVILLLNKYNDIYLLENYINKGIIYLKGKQNPDGGFGVNSSTVYETALVFLALIENGQGQAQILQNAINYLTTAQLANGSWNDDPYSTALALRALTNIKPNLAIYSTDITFSNSNPKIGDTITITATISNDGPTNATNIAVQFYDGDPSSGGALIGETTIPEITAFGSTPVSMSWTIPTASSRKVFVKIDPQNAIDELDETDNIASQNLTSATLPDLTIGSTDIAFSPDPPKVGEPITLSITVHNNGQSTAENFSAYVYAGNPDQGGIKIGEATYTNVAGGGMGTFQIPWTVAQGVDRITVKVDPLNQVTESNEDNNQTFRLLNSTIPPVEGIDLVAVPKSFSFSPGIVQESQPITITAVVLNNGTLAATDIAIDFFDKDPSNSINKIYSTVISTLAPGAKQSVSFQNSFIKGAHTIYMEVDPQNLITETIETNNEVCAGINVLEVSGMIEQTIPRNLKGTSTKSSITIRWDAATRFYMGGYIVYRDGVRQNDTPITQTTYTDTGLPNGTLYHYQVTSIDEWGGGESPKSQTLSISTVIYDIDLKVDYQDVTITPADAKTGDTVTISAKIHNLGTDPVSNIAVHLYTLEASINTIQIPSIGPTGEYVVQTTWVVTDPNDFIYIQVDPDNMHLELNEFNNLAIVSIIKNIRFTQINQATQTSYRAMGDLDNDGDLDILNSNASILLVNNGQGNFTRILGSTIGFKSGQDYSSAFGDIDNDGYLDVFVCSTTGDNRLYRNNGNLTFTDITQQAGLKGINTYTVNAVFGDLNNDGKLDLFVGAFGGEQYIYLNNGNGTFKKVPGFTDGYENVELGDLDGDGYLDVVVCSGSNAVIYKNDGTGHFTKHQSLPGSDWDVALGDMDNDGYLDIITLNPGRVYYNDGHGNFSLANSVLLPKYGGYTVNVADFDNDGDLDIFYSSNGYLLRNDGNRKFTDISALFNSTMPWYTVLLGDIDNDGDIDIVGGVNIYKNEMNNNNYLIFSLRGKQSNYYGIGSKISVYEEGHLGERDHLKGFRQVQAGGQGYVSQDSSDAHFGVNSNYKYDVQVIFPASKIVVNRRSTTTGQKLILPEIGDVSINSDNISLSSNTPLVGEKVVITAQVQNPTAIDMENVTVGFYDGDPAAGGVELGHLTMGYVPAQGTKEFPIEVTAPEGIHEIYVVIDPDNSILETDKTNNKASKTLTVSPRIIEQDLSISASDVGIDPATPWDGAQATISAVVHLSGEKDIQDVNVSFYDGDPSQGGMLIGSAKIATIPVNGSSQTQIQWNTLGKSGLHYIHVVVDPLNSIRETNENNNIGIISVNVVLPEKPDLTVTSSDIVLSNTSPSEGETITVTATVHNLGLTTGNVDASLYDGDPSAGGRFLAKSTNMQTIPLGGTAVFKFEVNTVGLSGLHNLFVSVDPDNKIDEMNETNNISSNSATVDQAGLGLGMVMDKSIYTANEDAQMTVNLTNQKSSNRSGTLEVKILDTGNNVVSIVSSSSLTLTSNETRAKTFTWNTAKTLSGDYKAFCQFIESGNVIAKAEASFTITPVKEISSKVTADKISYTSNQPVTIISTIKSISPNFIFSNLNAKIEILDNQGTSLFTDLKTISTLTLGQMMELKTYWNTTIQLKGIYTVKLEVFEGSSVLSTSTTSFTIIGSTETVSGITGTISASPSPIHQGRTETLTYSITNQGNEDLSGLTAKILIVNPDTKEITHTLESPINLLMNQTFTENLTASTSGLSPRIYLAILQVFSPAMTEPKALASATFEVIAGLEITKTIPDTMNLLVWINQKCEGKHPDQKSIQKPIVGCQGPGQPPPSHPETCIRMDLLEKILQETGVHYYFVYDEEEFEKEMRNPFYTDFMILGDHEPLTDHHAQELREQVNSGKGLFSSLYLKHGQCLQPGFHHDDDDDDDSLFGLTYRGQLPGLTHNVRIPEGPLSGEISLKARGDGVRVEVNDSQRILGWIKWQKGYQCQPTPREYPGIVKNQYGRGKTLFFGFDIGETLDDKTYAILSTVLKNSLTLIHTSANQTAFAPNQFVPVLITLKSLGGAFDLRVTETYPQKLRLYDSATGQWITDRPWIFDFHLNTDETKDILYEVWTPDVPGTYVLKTDVATAESGVYTPYQSLSVTIPVEKDTAEMTEGILDALDDLQVTTNLDKAAVKIAVMFIGNVKHSKGKSPFEQEKKIEDILKAIESLMSVKTADTSTVRLMMDALLKIWEARVYASPDSHPQHNS